VTDPEAPAVPGDEPPPTLRQVLRAMDVSEAEIEQARRDGTASLLAIEHLVLTDPPEMDLAELTRRAAVSPEQVADLWRALGFADPMPGEKVFTKADVEMLDLVTGLIDSGVAEPDLVLQMTRVVGSSIARIALAQIEAFGLDDETDDATSSSEVLDSPDFAERAGVVLPTMPKVMAYVWQRHMQAAARSRVLRAATVPQEGSPQAVGFADLVGFTALSQQVSAHELAEVVSRFEGLAYDTVARLGGRVVKMIGDEVMFNVVDPRQAAEIALTLAETYRDDDELSDVRVGLAYGPVLEREGDCFGPVVNLASRIVGIAFPGTVVVSDELHAAMVDDDDFVWRSLHRRQLKDIGRVMLWTIRRSSDPFGPKSRRDRARLERTERFEEAVERRTDRGGRHSAD
jgi:adenylate cyclase